MNETLDSISKESSQNTNAKHNDSTSNIRLQHSSESEVNAESDIIGVCARYQVVGQVLRYVNYTVDHGIFYSKDTTTHLVGYNGADWARNCAKYITARGCCTQLLQMKQMLSDYRIAQMHLLMLFDSINAIKIKQNLRQNNKMKHIDIRHHFIREVVETRSY